MSFISPKTSLNSLIRMVKTDDIEVPSIPQMSPMSISVMRQYTDESNQD